MPTTTTDAAKFVDVTAKMSLVMALLGVVYSLLQLGTIVVVGWLSPRQWLAEHDLPLPASWNWWADHALALGVACLVASLAFLVVSWGLLKRQPWSRVGLIAFLIVVALANFACLPLVDAFFSGLLATLPADVADDPELLQAMSQFHVTRWVTLLMSAVACLAIAALHGWMVIKLGRAPVRAVFNGSGQR